LLQTGIAALPFPLLVFGLVLVPLEPLATSTLVINTPQDSSPFYRMAMLISSRVGSSLSSLVHIAYSEHRGAQTGGGVMKMVEHRSGLNFPSMVLSMSRAKLDPQPRSSHMASPSPVNCHTGRTRDWMG
jgi:hypothetical protein